jgi:hypothetical protein
MRNGRTTERVSVVSVSELLVMFVTPNCEGTARNMSEWRKII